MWKRGAKGRPPTSAFFASPRRVAARCGRTSLIQALVEPAPFDAYRRAFKPCHDKAAEEMHSARPPDYQPPVRQ